MSITVWGILLGALLLAIPVYVIYRFKLKIINRVLAAVCRMVLVVFATALLAYTTIKLNSVGFSIVAFLLLVSVSSILVVRKSGLKPTKLLIPVIGGMLLTTSVIGFYVLFFVLGLKNPFVPQYFLPVMGLIAFGFVLMMGYGANTKPDGSYDPNYWNEDIFSVVKIRIAPLLVVAGFVVQVVAILKRNK